MKTQMAKEKDAPDNTHLSSAKEHGRGYHDIGGLPAGPIPKDMIETRPWEKLSVVIGNALGSSGTKQICTDEGRRAREEYGVELYNELGYFEKGTVALRNLLV